MAKRITEKQKKEISQLFESGESIESLSRKYNCNKLTIIRNLKKNIGEKKYKELTIKNKSLGLKTLKEENQINNFLNKQSENVSINHYSEDLNNAKAKIAQADFIPEDSFLEIAPIDYEMNDSSRKELSSVSISDVDFPKVVYMIVDKKIELEIKLLKDFPEWEFLPNDDLHRKTIEIFFDLNLAKRSCNKDQKVLKVPNTDVFRIAAPVLIAKGISRIVCAENLIAL